MNQVTGLGAKITETFEAMFVAVVAFLPQLLIALAVLLVGWLVARLLRGLTVRLAHGLDHFIRSVGMQRSASHFRVSDTGAAIIGSIVYWLVILVFVTIASQQLGLRLFTGWLDQIVGYLPQLISGAFIVFVGVVIANLVRDTVVALAGAVPEAQRTALGRAAQILTLTTMVIVGIDQIGIDVTLINTLIAVVVAAFLGGLSIAFSLGARTFVANLLGIRYLGGDVEVGQRIRIDGIDGTVVEMNQTSIVLDTADGPTRIPGRFFSEKPIVVVTGATDGR